MELQVIPGITFTDIAAHTDNYPDEVVVAAIYCINTVTRDLREKKLLIEGRLIERMLKDNATKLPFKHLSGMPMMASIKTGAMECKHKEADKIFSDAGFHASEIGTYEFKPVWSKAKEVRKLGGEKQRIIDELFKPGKPSLKIEES